MKIQSPAATSFLAGLPPIQMLEERVVKATELPVMSVLDNLGPTVPKTLTLVTTILRSATSQAWRQPYTAEDFGADFAARSGWFPIADRDGPLVMIDGLVEIMLLDARLQYPVHSHAPEELYIVLAGAVYWEAQDAPEEPGWRNAGDLIHHPPHRRHSIATGETAALILTLWRGGGFEKPKIT